MSEVVVQTLEVEVYDRQDEVDEVDEQEPCTSLVARRSQRGMVSAEWAVGLIAAIAIAGVLLTVVTTGTVREGMLRFILAVIARFAKNL